MILRANGRSGQMEFDGKNVTITHEGYTARTAHGSSQGKVIPISSINAIQFKPATTLFLGSIQLSIEGETARSYRPNSLAGIAHNTDIAKDENAILFAKGATTDFQEMAATIRAAIDTRNVTANPQIFTDGPLEQIAKLGALLSSGLLTQAEFDTKKASILSRI